MLETIRWLGAVQMDPTRAVERTEHLVLWSRLGRRYRPAELERLLWQERELFEYEAFILPTSDLPVHRESMRRYPSGNAARHVYVRRYLRENAASRRRRRARSGVPPEDRAALAVRRPDLRPPADRGAVRLPLPPGDLCPEGHARVRLLRDADPARRPADRPYRPHLRPGGGELHVRAVHAEPGAPVSAGPAVARTIGELASWLGAKDVAYGRALPSAWCRALLA